MKLKVLILLPVAAFCLSGCGAIVSTAIKTVANQTRQNNTSAAASGYLASLQPLPSGAGLVVGAPVAKDAKLADFGAGCARWIFLHAGGQGELGKTPLWGTVDNGRKQIGAKNWQLTPEQGAKLAQAVGATHAATGEIANQNGKIRLIFALQKADDNSQVGEPLVLTGTREQIVAQLPAAARQIAARLGAKKPVVPAKIAIKTDELEFLGAVPYWGAQTDDMTEIEAAQLRKISPREPLASVLLERGGTIKTDEAWAPIVAQAVRNAPQNPLVIGDIAFLGAQMLKTHNAVFSKTAKQFPKNYIMAAAQSCAHRVAGDRTGELNWAETAVRAAPNNPTAWLELSAALGNNAQDLRDSRWAKDVSQSEWTTLSDLYGKRLAASQKITELAPDWTFGWSDLAEAATFAGNQGQAEDALWKALELDPANSEAYNWGMQMLQPKWGGNSKDLLTLCQQAAKNSDKASIGARTLVSALEATEQSDQTKGLLEQIVQNDPKNAGAAAELGAIYHYKESDYQKAEQLYVAALAANPDDAQANSSLGDLHQFVKNDPAGAEKLYRRAIALEPANGYFHANLGRCLWLNGRQSEGVAEAQQAKALGFKADHPVWDLVGVKP